MRRYHGSNYLSVEDQSKWWVVTIPTTNTFLEFLTSSVFGLPVSLQTVFLKK